MALLNLPVRDVKIRGRLVRIATLDGDKYEALDQPEALIESLRASRRGIDIFTFAQILPHKSPKHGFPMEWDNVAALPISTYEHWFTKQIDGKTRNMVRRAEKKGVSVREVPFDDMLVTGIWEIYNECPIRQGKPFPHFGKDVEVVRKISATFMETSLFIGAFFEEKLIGFIKLTTDQARAQASIMHIVAMLKHRDKSTTNALISQAVESCAARHIPYLVYSNFAYGKKQRDTLSDFKSSNGFQRIEVPRYYVALTAVGRVALRLGLHHGLLGYVPEPMLAKFRELRAAYHSRRVASANQAS